VNATNDRVRRDRTEAGDVSSWERSRRPLVVHPPTFVAMTERDKQQVLEALVALLIPYLRSRTADADERP